jgi:hypothetical protein
MYQLAKGVAQRDLARDGTRCMIEVLSLLTHAEASNI